MWVPMQTHSTAEHACSASRSTPSSDLSSSGSVGTTGGGGGAGCTRRNRMNDMLLARRSMTRLRTDASEDDAGGWLFCTSWPTNFASRHEIDTRSELFSVASTVILTIVTARRAATRRSRSTRFRWRRSMRTYCCCACACGWMVMTVVPRVGFPLVTGSTTE